ncbi:hypothetical protein [Aquabacterium sp. OR-4]|uniref:hypothetical protein n=1 Tax=Aquabacterium sp. OR-4 TaxID=2978127 RepID=UPI0028C857A9|nr:hypothetical protein [Aquabacterium sp. OR-4]MDT7836056.1 hypothetical protein [Aquabacterium sp. OR-4]MDT7839089.1 hypothetical protein [Aquabacterium sp. OR-4]
MSMALSLELESGIHEDHLRQAAFDCGAVSPSDDHPNGTLAVFAESGLDLFVHSQDGRHAVRAEGMPYPAAWTVGLRVSLGYLLDRYDLCNRDARQLLDALAKRTSKFFVLSFEYERVYALRDAHGLQYFDDSLSPPVS